MNYFAHNGVDHSSVTEAAAHSANDFLLTVILVTLVVLVAMGTSLWANRRFNAVAVKANKKNRS